jgi:trans-2,3-dihydro-3-hydroxyanthranilate isomerase
MQRRYVTADVFTDTMFGGNPVAVVLDAQGLSTAQMQCIAIEFNYSETTFVLPPEDAAHTAKVRIFTPAREVPFAGHPNVGTAFVLAQQMQRLGQTLPPSFTFEEGAGLVPLRLISENNTIVGAELTAPEALSLRATTTPENIAACLTLNATDIETISHLPQVASVGLPFLIAEIKTRDALRRIVQNQVAFKALLPFDGAHGLFAYTRDVGEGADCDLQARMFSIRMIEDPATGSAVVAATAFLTHLLDVESGDLSLRIRQGVDMGRPSLLLSHGRKENGLVTSARVGGQCVTVLEGGFTLTGAA